MRIVHDNILNWLNVPALTSFIYDYCHMLWKVHSSDFTRIFSATHLAELMEIW